MAYLVDASLGSIPTLHKPDVVAHICDPSTSVCVEAGGLGFQIPPQLHVVFEASVSLGYVRHCLK